MTNNSFLVATLVLSSSISLCEAFSTSSLQSRQRAVSTTRHYAPKDSLSGSTPKRRRGRPRKYATAVSAIVKKKSTTTSRRRPRNTGATTTTATAATTASSDAGGVSTTKPGSQRSFPTAKMSRKKKNNRSKEMPPTSFLNGMLDHDLLSKEEELALGAQVRLALEVQGKIAEWMEANKERLLQRHQYEQLERIDTHEDFLNSHYNNNDYFFHLSTGDDSDNPLYGSASSQAMERHFADQADEELFYQDGSSLADEDMAYGMTTDHYAVFQPQLQQLKPSVPDSWMDDIMLSDDSSPSSTGTPSTSSSFGLTDDDIHQILDIPGGRSQLRTALLEGALARERLIRSNIKLVVSIAKKWHGEGPTNGNGDSLARVYSGGATITGRPTLDEAIQEGVLGLAEAAERFDPDKGFRFSTYATIWVTNSVRKCFQLESSSGMRLPVPYYDIKRKYINQVRHYLNTQGEVPSMQVLAEEVGVSHKRLIAALRLSQPIMSLDSSVGAVRQGYAGAGKAGGFDIVDGGYTLESLLASDEPQPEDHVERSLLRQCLENAMATELTPNERDVVRLRLGLDDSVTRTAKEVADIYGGRFTVAAIRGIEQRAFNKLRSPFGLHTQKLMAYLDFAGIDGGLL